MAEIQFTDDAVNDLRRIGPEAVPKVLKKLLILEENAQAGFPLGGELTGFRKLIVGRNTWRIVYRVEGDTAEICEIRAVGARLIALVEVMERLGKLAEGLDVAVATPAEPVPDWLADRLIYTVGLRREEVAAMDLQQAVDTWATFVSEPPSGQ